MKYFLAWLGSLCVWIIPLQAEITVTPVRITESRSKEFMDQNEEPGGKHAWGTGHIMRLSLRFTGNELKGTTAYGHSKIAEVIDDTGRSLVKNPQSGFGSDKFISLLSQFAPQQGRTPNDAPMLDLQFDAAERRATKLVSVKGEVQFRAGGEEKTLTAGRMTALVGTALIDPLLDAARLKVSVVDPKRSKLLTAGGEGGNFLMLEFSGDTDCVSSIEVTDPASKAPCKIQGWTENDGTTTHDFHVATLDRPLNDAMTLKIQLFVGQKVVKVPFQLHDIPLP
jgi:hypothetical protein